MLRNWTIRTRLLVYGIFAIGLVALVGGMGLVAMRQLVQAMNASGTSVTAAHLQGDADMMHDAIRGDVLQLYRLQNTGAEVAAIQEVEKNFTEHAARLRKDVADNEVQIQAKAEKEALAALKPDLEAYIAQAAQQIESLKSASATQDGFAAFSRSFLRLEDSMGRFSELIENRAAQNRQEEERAAVQAQMGLIAVFFCALLLLFILSWAMAHSITAPLSNIRDFLLGFSGDLTLYLDEQGRDEVSNIAVSVNRLLREIATMIRLLGESSSQLVGVAQQLSMAADDASTRVHESSDKVVDLSAQAEMIAVAAEEVGQHIQTTASVVGEAARLAQQTSGQMNAVVADNQALSMQTQQAGNQIGMLSETASSIAAMAGQIREIADQTNLLALNAAIEAARAGEQGRGFAVVADEVRKLAERTAATTGDITRLTTQILSATDGAVSCMREVSAMVDLSAAHLHDSQQSQQQIVEQTGEALTHASGIASAAQQQGEAVQSVAVDVEEIANLTANNRQSIENLFATVTTLRELSCKLDGNISRYRV